MGLITVNNYSTQTIIDAVELGVAQMDSDIIASFIYGEPYAERAEKMKEMYRIYKQNKEALKISSKTAGDEKPNNKIPNDFSGEITDQKVGYSFGNPITYTLTANLDDIEPESIEFEKEAKRIKDLQMELDKFLAENKARKLDLKSARVQSICGTTGRLLYINDAKRIRVSHVDPWECVWIYDQSELEVVLAIRYYKMSGDDGIKDYHMVELYDDQNIYYFYEITEGKFTPVEENPVEPHNFKKVPLIEFPNKDERMGDFEKVMEQINAYDFITSFNQDELEEFRNTYLVFENVQITDEFISALRASGAMEIPEGATAKWLTKVLDPKFGDSHIQRLKDNIYKFAKAVDMSDEKFSGGTQTGESRKWKLKTMADDAVIKEASFESALYEMFEVISDVWNMFKFGFESTQLEIGFTPNLPMDLLYYADVSTKMKGNFSEELRLSLMPFVVDVKQEMARLEAQNENIFEDLEDEDAPFGDEEDDDGKPKKKNPFDKKKSKDE